MSRQVGSLACLGDSLRERSRRLCEGRWRGTQRRGRGRRRRGWLGRVSLQRQRADLPDPGGILQGRLLQHLLGMNYRLGPFSDRERLQCWSAAFIKQAPYVCHEHPEAE
eukprot:scaffold442595_cov42-Prasinocladus_malaysianus.AAC.1